MLRSLVGSEMCIRDSARTTEREGPRRRAPLPAARARGRETTSFAIRALVRRAACPRRRGGHGGPGVAETHVSRSRAPPSAASARVPRNVRRVFPARASARALPSPPSRARATRRRGHGVRARLQRGGTEPSVTPLSLSGASLLLSRAGGADPVVDRSTQPPRRCRRDAHRRRGGLESHGQRASRRRALVSRARSLSLSRLLSLSPALSLARERERAVDARGPRASCLLYTSPSPRDS